MPAETLFLDARKSYSVVASLHSMVDKGQISWAILPSSMKTRMRSIIRKYLEAANRGHAVAQSTLGELYYAGHGVRWDEEEAAKWLRKAAEQGLAEAQFNLGNKYKEGLGVKQDFNEAVKWYRQAAHQGLPAADQGLAKAQFNMGVMYKNGQGVKQDSKMSKIYSRLAADQGHAGALRSLSRMSDVGRGGVKPPSPAPSNASSVVVKLRVIVGGEATSDTMKKVKMGVSKSFGALKTGCKSQGYDESDVTLE
jgi:TPR repeat protein